jgi:hypothetical protein
MVELIAQELLPGFALAFYEPLKAAAGDAPPPKVLALLADDAIVLAPQRTATGWRGFLIAEDTAADQRRDFTLPGQPEPIALIVPPPAAGSAAAVWAAAAASLATPPSPDTPGSPPPPPA